MPLSKGRREGDAVVCAYHGLAFGPDGACLRIPSQSNVPDPVRAQSYPVVERAPLIWIWLGNPDEADAAGIPEHPWLDDAEFTHVGGYLHVKCNYVRLHENVLDLTHFPFLHGAAVGDLAYAQAPFEVVKSGDAVAITRTLQNHEVNAGYAAMIGNPGHRVDRTSVSWFLTPAFHIAHAEVRDLEGGVDGRTQFHFKIQHMFTPETATSTHYFWAAARDMKIDDHALSNAAKKQAVETFLEDVDALEDIEAVWARESSGFQEISVAGDRAGLLMRRILAKRAAREWGEAGS
jgi:phenylpropionate dioxygenase-like ring-hydroxylating dioxygenase large terminal subunit